MLDGSEWDEKKNSKLRDEYRARQESEQLRKERKYKVEREKKKILDSFSVVPSLSTEATKNGSFGVFRVNVEVLTFVPTIRNSIFSFFNISTCSRELEQYGFIYFFGESDKFRSLKIGEKIPEYFIDATFDFDINQYTFEVRERDER